MASRTLGTSPRISESTLQRWQAEAQKAPESAIAGLMCDLDAAAQDAAKRYPARSMGTATRHSEGKHASATETLVTMVA